MSGEKSSTIYEQRIADWEKKTGAIILSEERFNAAKKRNNWHVVGVAGFSGSWRKTGLPEDEIQKMIDDARLAIYTELVHLKEKYGPRLVISSGATNKGVLQIVYDLCDKLHITAVGMTADATLKYDVGRMAYVVPVGHEWGDESPTFVRTSDELIILGGGNQTGTEARAIARMNKPVTVITGFGGVTDTLHKEDVPGARFVKGRHH